MDLKSIAFILDYIDTVAPDVVTVHLTFPDHAGHKHGAVGYEYWHACNVVDKQIERVATAFLAKRPKGLVLVSADHGVTALPELVRRRGVEARRLGGEDVACIQRVNRRLRVDFGDEDWFFAGFYLDRDLVRDKGVDPRAMGMKDPSEGTRAQRHLLFGEVGGTGWYFGSDAQRSPIDRYRSPGDPPYTGP